MGYKDPEKAKEAARLRKQKQRMSHPDVTPAEMSRPEPEENVTPSVNVTPNVTPLDEAWQHVKDYISAPCTGMNRLERMQRVAGSLGKNSGRVWFGFKGLTMADIGRVIGTQEPAHSR